MDLKAHFNDFKNSVKTLLNASDDQINADTTPAELNAIIESAAAKINESNSSTELTEAVSNLIADNAKLVSRIETLETADAVDTSSFATVKSVNDLQESFDSLKADMVQGIKGLKSDIGAEINKIKGASASSAKKEEGSIFNAVKDVKENDKKDVMQVGSFDAFMNGTVAAN